MPRAPKLSAQLRAWRKAHRLSQSEAALRLRCNIDTLQNWEQDRRTPSGFARRALLEKITK